jgi:phospholipase/lecithinase/hemolysin
MRKLTRYGLAAGMAAVLAWSLAGCGGNDSLPAKTSITKVYVMGDSLADVGTFGLKFTVQDSSNPKGFPIWPQIVAGNFGLDAVSQCNFFASTNGITFTPNSTAGCTNFAIGNGRIFAGTSFGGASSPYNVGVQMATKVTSSGNYLPTDLVLIDGGGNDASDLVSAYLGAAAGGAGLTAYQAFLAQQLPGATIAALLPQTNGAALAAGAYMQALANTFYASINTQVLQKNGSKVAILNMPDITVTPKLQMVLGSLGASGPALQSAVRQWITAFNTQLKTNIANDSRIALVDFYYDINDEVTNPASYGLSNATSTACPATGVGSDGLPTYTFTTCTSTALDATTGKTPGWWKTYAFSDGFHPTPMAHGLLASSVARALARAGWL